jgi:hypothetical protein
MLLNKELFIGGAICGVSGLERKLGEKGLFNFSFQMNLTPFLLRG